MTTEAEATQLEANDVTQTESGTGTADTAQEFLDSLASGSAATQAEGGTGASGGETETSNGEPEVIDKLADDYIKAEANRLAEEKLKAEAAAKQRAKHEATRKREEEGIANFFQQVAPQTRAFLEQQGLSEDAVNKVLTAMNGLRGTGYRAALAHALDDLIDTITEEIPEDERGEVLSRLERDWRSPPSPEEGSAYLAKVRDVIGEYYRKGYVPETEAVKREQEARLQLVRDLMKDGGAGARALLSRAHAPPESLGANAASGGRHFTSEAELNRAYNDPSNPLYNDHARYALEYERITGRKP